MPALDRTQSDSRAVESSLLVGRHLGVAAVATVVVALSSLPRLLLAFDALPASLRPFTWNDLVATYIWRELGPHNLPYFDVQFEYPPLAGYLAGAFAVMTTGVSGYLILWTILVIASAAALAFVLSAEVGARRALVYWALSPQLLLYAGLNFDVLPTALLGFAVVAARRRQAAATGIVLALGTAAKLFPAACAPLLLLRGRPGPRAALWFALACAALFAPALLASKSASQGLGFYAGVEAGGVSVWGLLTSGLAGLGLPGASTLVLALTTGGLVATYFLIVVPRARASPDPAVGFALATLTTLLWTRLYSPQFSLWVLPFFALLCTMRVRSFWVLATADVVVFLTASPLTLVPWNHEAPAFALLIGVLAAAVAIRHLGLILAFRDALGPSPR